MTAYPAGSGPTSDTLYVPPTWVRILLGVVFIAGGVIVLGDVVLATVISTIFIGATALVAGGFEIVHAFWTKGWGGFFWQLVLGILYIAFGFILVTQPVTGALVLTFFLGAMLVVSGLVRIVLGLRHWHEAGWIMFLSGAFGLIAGLVIVTGWPLTGLVVLGYLLAFDLMLHGFAWLTCSWGRAPRPA